jgi:glycosyltransferase involved in cell wall biosynthesis
LTSDIAPISVVIPAYNAERFIGDAIRSVHAQTLKPTEIIVIADDCTDRTKHIAAELGATVLEQKRRNMAAGLNLGISASTQPWIALLDADDVWENDKIALQWKAVEACPAAAIISCGLCTLCNGEVMASSKRALRERWKNLESVAVNEHCHYFGKVEGDFLVRFNIQTTTVLLRRDVFSSLGIFDESLLYGQTLEFFARVLARYPLAFVDKPLVYVRVHSANHTRNVDGYWVSYLSIVNRMLKNPDLYPPGAGKAHREDVKKRFLQTERVLVQSNGSAHSSATTGTDRRGARIPNAEGKDH